MNETLNMFYGAAGLIRTLGMTPDGCGDVPLARTHLLPGSQENNCDAQTSFLAGLSSSPWF